MDVQEVLCGLAAELSPSIKVKVVKTPTFVSVFYSADENPAEVILIYSEVNTGLTEDVISYKGERSPDDLDEFDLTGNPLEAPFEDFDDDISIVGEKPLGKWPKSEESYMPLPIKEARSLFVEFAFAHKGNRSLVRPLDVWAVTKPNESSGSDLQEKTKKHDILLGLRLSKEAQVEKRNLFARSVGSYENSCDIESPEMNLDNLKKQHMKLCGTNKNMQCQVLWVYHLSGNLLVGNSLSPFSAGSVHLEVKWHQPKKEPPLDAVSVLAIQGVLGNEMTGVDLLWKQLLTVSQLLSVLRIALRDNSLEKVSTWSSEMNEFLKKNDEQEKASIADQLKQLFEGGFSSQLDCQRESEFTCSSRISIAPRRTTIYRTEDDSKERKLKRNTQQVLSNKRMNADATDDLWAVLSGVANSKELANAFDTIYREVKQGKWKPYIRHKNESRTANLIKMLCNANSNGCPDLTFFEASGISFGLESLIELGLEKLSHDYIYVFMESDLASRDEIRPPPFPKKSLGVPQDAWLSSCEEYFTWLARMHASLEVVLLAEDALTHIDQALASVSSQALKHFQGTNSPVKSTNFLTLDNQCVDFRASLNTHQIRELLSQRFETWQLRFTSESPTRIVETVFHRSASPIFPPQFISGVSEGDPGHGKSSYFCYKMVNLVTFS